jgi:WD40 repeat protein
VAELSGEGGLSSSSEGGYPLLRAVPFGQFLAGHTARVRWGAWNPLDGRPILATGGDDGTVRLWDSAAGAAPGRPLDGHTGPVRWGAWGSHGNELVLATGGSDGTVRMWSAVSGTGSGQLLTDRVGVTRWGKWEPYGRPILAAGGDDGTVWLWGLDSSTSLRKALNGHAGPVRWGEWSTSRYPPVLATGGDDGTVRFWDGAAAVAVGEPLTGHTGAVRWGAWCSVDDGGPLLFTGGGDGTVRRWNLDTGSAQGEPLTGHAGPVLWGACGFAGGREVLATGDDRTIRLWDVADGTALGELTGHSGPVTWGAWASLDGRSVLVTGGVNGTLRLWDPATGTAPGPAVTVRLGPLWWGTWGSVDGRPVLATGGQDNMVQLWEVIEDRPVPRLPSYQSDVSAPSDELSRTADAVALAELVTAKSARPPLAVGLFGDWGEGKSHFLGLLREQVALTARPDNLLAHSAIRQVQFNAWHYAETDLWASLVTELFAQLTVPPDGDLGAEQRRQSRLAGDLVAQRGLRERLQAARGRRDDLQEALRSAERDDLGSWEALTDEQKQQLTLLTGGNAEKYYRDAIRTAASLGQTGRLSWRLLRSLRPAAVARLVAVLVVIIAIAVGVGWLIPSAVHWVVTASAAATVLATVAGLYRHVRAETVKRASAAWRTAVRMGQAQRERLQTASDVAAAEVVTLEREVQNLTAAGQLAGLTADRAASQDYRGRLGVMTQIREDFSRMAALLAEAGGAGEPDADAAGDALPRIDRIVLYIDDLDRCPPRRVVEMLEAIHLLLAVPLFVVVVAVDPRWLLRAIAAHYRELLQAPDSQVSLGEQGGPVDPDDEELWNSTPAQYLEKIFQVVLTLPPLDTSGYQRMLRTLVGAREDPAAPAEAAAPSATPAPAAADPTARPRADKVAPGNPRWPEPELFGTKLPAARLVERVDPLTLEPDELSLLDLLGPPLLVTTPRTAKRLANSYGLLTALRRDDRAADLGQHEAEVADQATGAIRTVTYYPYRAGMVLLSALVAFPALGPALFLHLHHTATEHPRQAWEHYLVTLTPSARSGRWHNAADPAMTPVQAQQWQALIDALLRTTRTAREHKLPLPEPLGAWHQWVVPVGRLSFPTGRIISTLDRQRPLP